jgi:hypothetical protein
MEGEALRRRPLRSSFLQDRQTFFDQRQVPKAGRVAGKSSRRMPHSKSWHLFKIALQFAKRLEVRQPSGAFVFISPTYKWSGRNRFVGGTVDFEKRATDFGQTLLSQDEVLMQAIFEDVTYRSEIEIVT